MTTSTISAPAAIAYLRRQDGLTPQLIADLIERMASEIRALSIAKGVPDKRDAALAKALAFVEAEADRREASFMASDGSPSDEEDLRYVTDAREVLNAIKGAISTPSPTSDILSQAADYVIVDKPEDLDR